MVVPKGGKVKLYVDATTTQRILIQSMFEHYQRAYDKVLEDVYYAFISKHKLFPDGAVSVAKTEEEIVEIERLRKMANSISDAPFYKQLNGGK